MNGRRKRSLLLGALLGTAACMESEPPPDAVDLGAADERAARLWDSIDGYEDWPTVEADEPLLIHALDSDEDPSADRSIYVVEPLDAEEPRLSIIERRGDEGTVLWGEFSLDGEFVYSLEEIASDSEVSFRIGRTKASDYACVGCHQGSSK